VGALLRDLRFALRQLLRSPAGPDNRLNGYFTMYSARILATALAVLLLGPVSARGQTPERLTLDRAIAIALEGSPAVQRAEASRLVGRAERADAYGVFLPSLSLSTGLSQSEVLQRTVTDPITGGIISLPDSLVEHRQSYGTQAALSANWTLFSGGRQFAQAAARRSRSRAADEEVAAAHVQVAADATIAYLDALIAEALVDVRRAEATHARALEETAQTRFDLGQVPEIDLLQARLAASEAEIALLTAEGDARAARLALLAGIGLPDDRPYALVPPDAAVRADTAGVRRRVLAESPVLARLRAEREAAGQEARQPRLDLLPSVTLGATWIRSEFGQTREAITTSPQNTQAYYRLTFSWSPLEQPSAIFADRYRARAGVLSAEAGLNAGLRTVEQELDAGLDRWARATVLRDRARLNVELAERQREQAEERYRLGLATLTERLNAHALWAEAARQETQARYAPLRAVAEIARASGVSVLDVRP
jgi:outer membrane protein